MVQVYNKMSDYNDKELWSANKQLGYSIPNT
jgi:hypothetical protein